MTRRRFVPNGFPALLRWFVQNYRAETETDLHTPGVWRDRKRIGDPKDYDPVGGSALGAPREAEAFAVILYDPASRTEFAEFDGSHSTTRSYANPTRWTVEFLGRRRPFMAGVLRWIGRGQDWRDLAVTCSTCSSSVTLPVEYSEAITLHALTLAAQHYLEEPTARPVGWVDKSESQQQAEGAA